MITSRADLFCLACLSTGIPRPLSVTVTTPSAPMRVTMVSA